MSAFRAHRCPQRRRNSRKCIQVAYAQLTVALVHLCVRLDAPAPGPKPTEMVPSEYRVVLPGALVMSCRWDFVVSQRESDCPLAAPMTHTCFRGPGAPSLPSAHTCFNMADDPPRSSP